MPPRFMGGGLLSGAVAVLQSEVLGADVRTRARASLGRRPPIGSRAAVRATWEGAAMSHPIADDFAGIAARMRGQVTDEDPDAELLRLHLALAAQGEELARIMAEGDDLPSGFTPASEDQERRLDEANDAWWSLFDEITAIPAQGLAGQRAKAATMLLVLEHTIGNGIDGDNR